MARRFMILLALAALDAHAFCGFYVAQGNAKLFNRASKVVMVRDGDRTVLTMASDFEGDPRRFAVVIPVPTPITREQIHVGDKALIDHLDAYSSPRLVEYFDPDPCHIAVYEGMPAAASINVSKMARDEAARARSLGVTIEARYTVGEYDILILSAAQSNGLETWLRGNGYTIPNGASAVLGSYIRQKMKFFVARVNLTEQARLGYSYLRPLQVAYESPKFMLPIRLGTVNAAGAQELFVFAITRKGRVETTNYRTVKLPSDVDVPLYIRDDFAPFYKALFDEQVRREDMHAIFTEYAWDMNWCDPCAADPLSHEELRKLGVFWIDGDRGGAAGAFLTRLHVRYDRAHFPEDLVFQETADRRNFQARYILHHPWKGSSDCNAASAYLRSLRARRESEAENVATLTGWNVADVLRKMHLAAVEMPREKRWWERLWN